MSRLNTKKNGLKKPIASAVKSAAVKTAAKKKSVTKPPVKAATKRKPQAEQAVASDGIPWPPLPRIYGRGNLTAKQIREAVLRAIAAVEADRLAVKTHSDEVAP